MHLTLIPPDQWLLVNHAQLNQISAVPHIIRRPARYSAECRTRFLVQRFRQKWFKDQAHHALDRMLVRNKVGQVQFSARLFCFCI